MSTYIDRFGERRVRTPVQEVWLWFQKDHTAMFGLLLLGLLTIFIALSPVLAPYAPDRQFADHMLLPPAWSEGGELRHILGTDELGRDLFSRLLIGGRTTLGIALLMVLAATLVGTSLALFAVRLGSLSDRLVTFIAKTLLSLTPLVLALFLVAVLGFGLMNAALALVMAYTPVFYQTVRDAIHEELSTPYATSAAMDGASYRQLLFEIIFPNIAPMVVIQVTRLLTLSVVDIATLGFLGFGAQSPTAEWGAMLGTAAAHAYQSPWLIVLPGMVVVLSLFAIHLVGAGVRHAIEKQRGG